MIDLEKAKSEYIKYSNKFNLENENLKRKQLHSFRVMKISNIIAQDLKLNQEEIKIANLIGLLHDIARYEQFTKYGTFRDRESIDHGDLGVEILKKDDYIKKYIDNEKDIDMVCLAIKNHNKFRIEEGISGKQEMFCKIIRDADKTDIFYEATEIFYNDNEIKEINQSELSDDIVKEIFKAKSVNRNNIKQRGKLIHVLIMCAFLFDINFNSTFNIIYQENYINKIFSRFEFQKEDTRNKMKQIQEFLNKFIEEKLKG